MASCIWPPLCSVPARPPAAHAASLLEVARLPGGQVLAPGRGARDAAVALRLREAGVRAGATDDLGEADLEGADLRDRGALDAGLLLLRRGPHAVAEAVLVQALLQAHLAQPVSLVDDELADALGADLHHVQAPTVASRQGAACRR